VLPKLAGLRLAESTVERSTEAAGERLVGIQKLLPSIIFAAGGFGRRKG
jgi:hypothetical protein